MIGYKILAYGMLTHNARDLAAMRIKVELIRGPDSMTVEAYLVELAQKWIC